MAIALNWFKLDADHHSRPKMSTAQTKVEHTMGPPSKSSEFVVGFDPAAHWHEKLRDGTSVFIRPICKEDAALERSFIEGLSPESHRYRFLGHLKVTDDMVRRLTEIDYRRDMAFIALTDDAAEPKEIGVSRFCLSQDGESCEFAVTVSDECQRKGLATLLMRHLIEVARQRGIKRMVSIDAGGNAGMRDLAKGLGFNREVDHDYPSQVIYTLDL